jgi:acetyl esterase/lipase
MPSTLRYGPDDGQDVDVWRPGADGRRPVVIAIHGGFWLAEYDRAYLAPACAALAEAGYLTCSLEYRRAGQPGGGWPGTFADIATALGRIPELLGKDADHDRIALLGHSAGAHLALWAAGAHRLPETHPLHRNGPFPARGIVSLGGIGDLAAIDGTEIGGPAVRELLGGDRETVPDRYRAADPAGLVPTGVRVILVHGSRDGEVPVAASGGYADRARAAGDDVELRILPDIGHFQPVKPNSPAWAEVPRAIADVLR